MQQEALPLQSIPRGAKKLTLPKMNHVKQVCPCCGTLIDQHFDWLYYGNDPLYVNKCKVEQADYERSLTRKDKIAMWIKAHDNGILATAGLGLFLEGVNIIMNGGPQDLAFLFFVFGGATGLFGVARGIPY
jgi:hypothetical protein